MKGIKQIISILLTLAMTMSMIAIPALAEETTEIEKVITDNTVLAEPFDVTNEEEVDAGLYPYDQKTVLVKFAKKTKTLDVDGIASIEYLFKAKDGFWYTAHLADGTTPKMAIEALRSTPSVLVAEYNFLYETDGPLEDGVGVAEEVHKNPKYDKQWHLDTCGIQEAWKKMKKDDMNPGGSSGIVVAVIDTGVDFDHEDLKNNMWVNSGEVPGDGRDNDGNGYVDDYYGVDIVAKKGNGDDDQGHGTHVAGIIAAANNNVGIVGIAYNTKIMAIKAGQASGYFLSTDICKAIDYARENGADVINMSFGGVSPTIAVQDALEEAYTHSVLVASAGNDGKINEGANSKPCYPAAYSFVLGVMAVDNHGKETEFTNYDADGFNSVEYELYAPGSAITSTIPNDKYATWNGTSMAAPIVSGMAAVLRNVYNDPDMYPTKFIYGQLASTSERKAECFNPTLHGKHNLPQIVNLHKAIEKMPKPEISVSEFKTFDTDDIHINNNGDGTIDAGEVISLGFELRNRWGMSEDTIVTIDALSQADIPNPYVEFSTDRNKYFDSVSVDYGSVGTYSTQDCGKIIENDLWTSWENPFYVKVAKDAPNETILKINVAVTCKNALDDKDKATYSSNATIELVVKNGVVLPQIINEDMTLTKDNYYIIQNQTIIEKGATVTVTEGTNIQFWTNDSTDPYADSYMAGLVVKGTLNCIGTEEEPVKIFPSDLMRRYRVTIYANGGKIYYNHTKFTNLCPMDRYDAYSAFTEAKNCEFTQYVKGALYYRYLENGEVITSTSNYPSATLTGGTAENCAFYNLGDSSSSYPLKLWVKCNKCIFVDSFIEFLNTTSDCVFYGNNNYWDSSSSGGVSSFTVPTTQKVTTSGISQMVTDKVAGRTYIQTTNLTLPMAKKMAEYIGGTVLCIESPEEMEFIKTSGLNGLLGAEYKDGKLCWVTTGKEIGEFIPIYNPSATGTTGLYLNSSGQIVKSSSTTSVILEVPREIYIEKISLPDNSITMETSESYQLIPDIYPVTAEQLPVLYFSGNPAVATVDENGFVTPVDEGTTKIYAFSEDMQVSASMQVSVKREVKVTEITAPEEMYIDIGNTKSLGVAVCPINHTKEVSFESSDESIVTVDENGKIKAISEGVAIITARAINNDKEIIEKEIVVYSCVPVTSVTAPDEFYIDLGNTKPLNIVLNPVSNLKKIEYTSSDEDIITVDNKGNITSVAEGTAVVTTTVFNDAGSISKSTVVYSSRPITKVDVPETLYLTRYEEKSLNVKFTPAKAVKKITYESSNPIVAKVDQNGTVKANYYGDLGTTIITITVENDNETLQFQTLVSVISSAPQKIEVEEFVNLDVGEEYALSPKILPYYASVLTYKCESSNEAVCYVDENNKLIAVGEGTALVNIVSDYSQDIYDTVLVKVGNEGYNDSNVRFAKYGYVVLEDNTLWEINDSTTNDIYFTEQKEHNLEGKIEDIHVEMSDIVFVLSEGEIYYCNSTSYYDFLEFQKLDDFSGNKVKKIHSVGSHLYAITENGKLYKHEYGSNWFELVEAVEDYFVHDVYVDCYPQCESSNCNATVYFSDGYPDEDQHPENTYSRDVYVFGYYNGMIYDEPVCIMTNITEFRGGYAAKWPGYDEVAILGYSGSDMFFTPCNYRERLARVSKNIYITYYTEDPEYTGMANDDYELRYKYTNTYGGGTLSDLMSCDEGSNTGILNVEQVFTQGGRFDLFYKTRTNGLYGWIGDYYNYSCDFETHRIVPGYTHDNTLPSFNENDINLKEAVLDEDNNITSSILNESILTVKFDTVIVPNDYNKAILYDSQNTAYYPSTKVDTKLTVDFEELAKDGTLVPGNQYLLKLQNIENLNGDKVAFDIVFTFNPYYGEELLQTTLCEYNAGLEPFGLTANLMLLNNEDDLHIHSFTTETVMPTLKAEGRITNVCECGVETETILPMKISRSGFSGVDYSNAFKKLVDSGFNTYFSGNAILNRLINTDVTKWLRFVAPSGEEKYSFGGNYWGTTNPELINHQIVDYNDYITLGDINEGEILTTAPENTFPFVTEAYLLDAEGEVQSIISGGKVKFVVKFNRDMDTEYGAKVFFGSSYPYAEYEIEGGFTDARTWVGETELKTVIENGYQFIRVTNGRTAADENGNHLKLYDDWARFGFEIDTTTAMAMMMQGYADNEGIHLEWMQDDYETLAGYNVYRADSEDGNYVRINKTVIPSDENTFTDTDVEPGKKYYYTFTTVLTDLSESKPAGKISVTAKDTMAPDVYHSPVYTATTGNKVIVLATVSDNIGIENAKLYYRVKGTDEWKTADMSKSNSKYTASIPASFVDLSGVEYYIAAFDGVNYTYAGSHTSENPYEIVVYQAVENNAKGDVDGDGNITVLDALKLLRAIYDESLLTQEEFLRADINGDGSLSAVEALRILQYANKTISSVLW